MPKPASYIPTPQTFPYSARVTKRETDSGLKENGHVPARDTAGQRQSGWRSSGDVLLPRHGGFIVEATYDGRLRFFLEVEVAGVVAFGVVPIESWVVERDAVES